MLLEFKVKIEKAYLIKKTHLNLKSISFLIKRWKYFKYWESRKYKVSKYCLGS